MPERATTRISAALAALILVFVGWQWWQSRLPASYSAMDMGYADFGGGPHFDHAASGAAALAHAGHGAAPATGPRDVTELDGDVTGRRPDVAIELTARAETSTLADGTRYDGYTLNGSTPGPTIQATEGDLVEVRFRNDNVPDGATLHWHGVDLPNAMDGVAGITQDAVRPGEEFVYRFVVEDAGSYWYHSHQVSHEQVRRGLFGGLVVLPRLDASQRAFDEQRDVMALVHSYGGVRTINGARETWRVGAEPGSTVRVRVANTDNTPLSLWVPTGPYRLLATDGHEINAPNPVEGASVVLGAGGRVDLELEVPEGGARIQTGGASIVVGEGDPPETSQPERRVDLLEYGAGSGEDDDLRGVAHADAFDRDFRYDIGRRPGFVGGRPGMWWTVNGHLYPDVPMYMVREGDTVRMTISNHSGEVHPMHLHGHRATVLSRNGEPVRGSPWLVDSLNVEDDETYEIAFVADNPGVWMDHCHNLPHARDGMIAHLMYEGVTTGFRMGQDPDNHPE